MRRVRQLSVHTIEGMGGRGGLPAWRSLGRIAGRQAEAGLRLAAAAGAAAFLIWRPGGALHRWQPSEGIALSRYRAWGCLPAV